MLIEARQIWNRWTRIGVVIRPRSISPSYRYIPVYTLLTCSGTSSGAVYVFGQSAVQVHFTLPNPNTGIKFIHLHGPHLLIIDTRYNLTAYSIALPGAERKTMHTVRGQVACVESDLSLDWFFMGLTDGSI